MMVGTKAIATLSTGYLNALDYAKQRVQGADLTQHGRQDRAAGHDHPPPRRPPLADAPEGVRRGAAGAGALHRDLAGHGSSCSSPPARRSDRGLAGQLARRVNDLLLPIVKGSARSGPGCCSAPSRCRPSAGPGFLQDYPIEQYVRDAKIDTLYEGTTAIQGMDFFFRKIVRDQGSGPPTWPTRSRSSPRATRATAARSTRSASCSAQALEDVQGIVGYWSGALHESDPRRAATSATSTRSGSTPPGCCWRCGDLVVGWLLLRQAEVAQEALRRAGVDRARTRRSTTARSRPRGSSPATCCPGSPPSGPSPRAPTTRSWTCDESRLLSRDVATVVADLMARPCWTLPSSMLRRSTHRGVRRVGASAGSGWCRR